MSNHDFYLCREPKKEPPYILSYKSNHSTLISPPNGWSGAVCCSAEKYEFPWYKRLWLFLTNRQAAMMGD